MTDKIKAGERFADWLAKGWNIGVFENKDLGHRMIGHRFALPFGDELKDAKIGEARAPDLPAIGLGWRYFLIAKPTTAEEAVDLVFRTLGEEA